MKKRQTRKNRAQKRKTRHRRRHNHSQKGGNRAETYFFVVSDSNSRVNYPEFRMINMHGDGKTGVFQLEEYLGDLTYGIEDYLSSLKKNREGKLLPKQMNVKKYVVHKPTYIPPVMFN